MDSMDATNNNLYANEILLHNILISTNNYINYSNNSINTINSNSNNIMTLLLHNYYLYNITSYLQQNP